MNISCELCHNLVEQDQEELIRLRAILASQRAKAEEWKQKADQYEPAMGTIILMVVEGLMGEEI